MCCTWLAACADTLEMCLPRGWCLLSLPLHNLKSAYWTVQDIKFNVHSHPTLSEVLDELFKQGHLEKLDRPDAKPKVAQKMPQEARI